ncbi:hypothetical protein VCR12J2_620255 [Vibrio coralliirubri]|nr:hypothetical protein VCR12J2_620255 [Vibrio coralliirubri]
MCNGSAFDYIARVASECNAFRLISLFKSKILFMRNKGVKTDKKASISLTKTNNLICQFRPTFKFRVDQ